MRSSDRLADTPANRRVNRLDHTVALVVVTVKMDKLRRVYLPKNRLPFRTFPAGGSFSAIAPSAHLLGVYSDPLLNRGVNEHRFVVAFFTVVATNRDTGYDSAPDTEWFTETDLPANLDPADLRILFDAFCFDGVAHQR